MPSGALWAGSPTSIGASFAQSSAVPVGLVAELATSGISASDPAGLAVVLVRVAVRPAEVAAGGDRHHLVGRVVVDVGLDDLAERVAVPAVGLVTGTGRCRAR